MKINMLFAGAALALAINSNLALAADSTAYNFPAYGWAKPNGKLSDGSSQNCPTGYVLVMTAGSNQYSCVNTIEYGNGTQATMCPVGYVLYDSGGNNFSCVNSIDNASLSNQAQGIDTGTESPCGAGQYLATVTSGPSAGIFVCGAVP